MAQKNFSILQLVSFVPKTYVSWLKKVEIKISGTKSDFLFSFTGRKKKTITDCNGCCIKVTKAGYIKNTFNAFLTNS